MYKNRKEEKEMKKIVSLLLCTCIMLSLVGPVKVADAAVMTKDYGFNIDKSLYDITWYETSNIWVKQDKSTDDKDFVKGVDLGYAKAALGFATTNRTINGKYYQRTLLRSEMVPRTVNGSKKGMSQDLLVILHKPTYQKNYFKEVEIQPQTKIGKTSYTISNSLSSTIGVGNSGLTAGFSGSITTSTSWEQSSLEVTTNVDDYGVEPLLNIGCPTWEYDYVSGSNSQQNNYLYGSSVQYGLLSWNSSNSSKASQVSYVDLEIRVKFGGGNKDKRDGRVKSTKKDGKTYILGEKKSFLNGCYAYKAGKTLYASSR